MKKLSNRFLIIAGVALASVLCLISRPLTLGIDLSGGTILVYQVREEVGRKVDLDELVAALKKRVNPEGVYDITIRKVGTDRIELIMPEDMADAAEDVKRKLTEEGSLEFRILASTSSAARFPARLKRLATEKEVEVDVLPEVEGFRWARLGEEVVTLPAQGKPTSVGARSLTDSAAEWEVNRYRGTKAVLTDKGEGGAARRRVLNVVRNTKDTLYFDQEVGPDAANIDGYRIDFADAANTLRDPLRMWEENRYAGVVAFLQDEDGQTTQAEVKSNTANTLEFTRDHGLRTIVGYQLSYNPSGITGAGNNEEQSLVLRRLRIPTQPGMFETYALYEVPRENQDVTGALLARANVQTDQQMRPAVGFELNSVGSRRFGSLTSQYAPREEGAFRYNLAILLDGELQSAPFINSRITDRGIIEMGGGGNAAQEVQFLVDILNAGSLPVALETPPLQEATIGPTLGEDTIRKGVMAIAVSLMFVPIFMIIYYHVAGVIAVVALLLNMAMLLASMALTGSSITLPGLAGFALTIGMAVDANVLIFERMREERDKGATVAQQIRNGFDRAWTTILDSNVTTMLIGLVLWAGGTEEVKGFALVLILGLLWNLFTAVYVSRALFDLAYTQGWLKRITMSRWISDLLNNSKFDFVGPRRLCMLASAVALAVCLGFFFNRGGANEKGDMYNIDFTGGTLVTVRVDDPAAKAGSGSAQVEEVRKLASEALPNVFVESLKIEGAPFARYNIRTTESDPVKVQDAVVESFGDRLVRVELTGSEATPIAEDNDEAAFPGGTSYALRFNLPQTPTKIADELAEILSASEPPIASPQTRIKVTNPDAGPNEPDAGAEDLTFATNLDPAVAKAAVEQLATRLSADKDFLFERLENFGSVVAGETRAKAIIAIVLSWAMMVGYLWFRFKSVSYGIAAVIALVHDVIIALGAVAIAGYKIDLPMVAAFLTLIGFSVNDTIVIFDRIREIKGKSPTLTPAVVNDAINVTLSRTVLTTFTTWSVVMIFYLFGGESLRGFSFCLVVGFLSGTYSTIFIAAPILIEWMGQGDKKTTIEELATNAR